MTIEDTPAIVPMILCRVLDPSASATRAKAASTPELVADDMTLRRPTASQTNGARMSTDVEHLTAAANFVSTGERAATNSQMNA